MIEQFLNNPNDFTQKLFRASRNDGFFFEPRHKEGKGEREEEAKGERGKAKEARVYAGQLRVLAS